MIGFGTLVCTAVRIRLRVFSAQFLDFHMFFQHAHYTIASGLEYPNEDSSGAAG